MRIIPTYKQFLEKKDKEDFEDKIKDHGYYKGISTSTARKKEDQMSKQAAMDDDDPEAYKKLPGDTKGKKLLKKSKHTKDYEELYGESLMEKKPKGAPDWHDSDAPEAEGRFRDLSPKDLAAWLIKTRKKDLKKISGSLTQQVVFNRKEDPKYAEKMERTRKEVYKQLGREDLLESATLDDLALVYEKKAEGDRGKIGNAKIEKALKKKSDETGVPIGLLRIVMRRGMAAWKSGHRPGAGQEQWGYARVNSFLTQAPGTWGRPKKDPKKGGPKGSYGADADVAKEVIDGGHDSKLKSK